MFSDSIRVRAINIKKLHRYTDWIISGQLDMFTFKKQILKKSFVRMVHYKLTDFSFFGKNDKHIPSVDEMQESRNSAKDLFQQQYDNEIVYDIFKKYKITGFYYLALFLKLKIFINNDSQSEPLEMELNYDDNSYSNLINYISENCQCDPALIKVFVNNKNLDEVDQALDMKKYKEIGLIAYTFPIKVQFNYLGHKDNILLKYNQPLKSYISEIQKYGFKFQSEQIVFTHNGLNIPEDQPIHEILKESASPVIINIEDFQPNKINIYVPFDYKNVEFKFDFDENDTIKILLSKIQNYFGISDDVFLTNGGRPIESNTKVTSFTEVLHPLLIHSKHKIVFKRSFVINGNSKILEINPTKRISNIIKQIAEDNCIDPSLVQLSYDKKVLNPNLYINNYFVPRNESITVEIKEFTKFLKIVFVCEEYCKEFKVGFLPNMMIRSIKMSKGFHDIIHYKDRINVFFSIQRKGRFLILVENKTFNDYEIKEDETITIYARSYKIFKYKEEQFPIDCHKSFKKIESSLIKYFKLTTNKFFIDHQGRICINNEDIDQYPNGEIFEIKDKQNLTFIIDYEGQCKITIENNKKVRDLLEELKKKNTKIDIRKIQLFNELDKPVNSNAYLYSLFSGNEENYIYKIQAKNTELFSFIMSNGKIFNEYLYPLMKIKDVKKELKNRKKKVNEESYFIFRGRIIDDNDLLSSIINEDDEPISIEEEIPDQIMITLKLKDEEKPLCQIAMVKGSTAYELRYLAAQPIQVRDADQICLIANDNLLNDDDELIDEMEVIVDFDPNKNKQMNDETLYRTLCEFKKFNTSKFSTKLKEDQDFSISFNMKHLKVLDTIKETEKSLIYIVVDTKTKLLMCKKVLKVNNADFECFQKAFKECEILCSINHPSVCRALAADPSEPVKNESGENVTTLALYTEFLRYELKKCLSENKLDNTAKARIVCEIAHGFHCIHQKGLIHKNFNIENVMLNSKLQAKIIGFGHAYVYEYLANDYANGDIESLTKTMDKSQESMKYMSPELLSEGKIDYKTDVYSFGIVLYYIFYGSLSKITIGNKIDGKTIELPRPSPSMNQYCIDLIKKCTSFNPDDRPTFEEVLQSMKKNSFSFASDIDKTILTNRDHELLLLDSKCLSKRYDFSTILAAHECDNSTDDFSDDEDEDPFEKGNGTYEASADLPDTEYVFKFKEPNEEPFKLQLPKDVTVKDVKDKISERNNVAFEDITIFVGNQRLADFNILTALVIPKTVHYFTVKIVDLNVSIICYKIK